MRNIHFLLCIVLFLVHMAEGLSSPPAEKRLITLADAVHLALEQNHELMAARLEVERADARVQEAWGYALPKIDFEARYARALKKPVFFFPNFLDEDSTKRNEVRAIEIGSDNSLDMSITATQVLFNSAVFTGVGAAKVYSQAAREVFRASEMSTVSKVRKAFYGVLVSGEVRKMMLENMANAEENLRNVGILADQGLVSEYDQLRARVSVENLRPEVINAENEYTLAVNNLKMAIGEPVTSDMEIIGELTFRAVDETILSDASRTALETNPSLSALRLQAQVNDAFVTAERSNYLPTLAAFGNYQYQAQRDDLRFRGRDFVGSSLVGLTLSLNIFSGLQTNARVQQAQLEVLKTHEQIAATEENLQTTVESVVLRLRMAQKRIEAQQQTVSLAQKGYTIAATRLTNGSGTQVELNDAQLALTQAKVNRIQAIHDYLSASADLDEALGRLPDFVQDRNGQ